jgi:hypothetical protein
MRSLILLAAIPLIACSFHGGDNDSQPGVPASGQGTTRTYAVADFTEVELKGADDADIRVGPGFSVRAEGPADRLDDLKIVKDGDTLKISRKSSAMSWSGGGRDVKVFVTMPRITAAGTAGSGDMTIDRAEGGAFTGSSAGSGDLSVATLKVDRLKLSIAGSGDISAAGTAGQASLSIAGSGNIKAEGLTANEANVTTAGSGDITATVNGPAKVRMMGSGDVDLGAGATCNVTKMGSGAVTCGH